VTRWIGVGLLPGLLPFAAAYEIRLFAAPRPPTLLDVFGGGDAMLVAVTWSVVALYDLIGLRRGHDDAWWALLAIATTIVVLGSVAYGSLTTVSVTGGVQTRQQQDTIATVSLWMLGAAAATSALAASLAPGPSGRTRD
jgi:hypothetical protein